jgi:hypothetical protein
VPRSFSIVDAPQKSPAWFAARTGRVTGTGAKDVLATIKSGEAAARRDLRVRLVVERLTGVPEDTGNGFVNEAMAWGLDHEAEARAAYESLTGQVAAETGFLAGTDLMVGCSLDGHLGDFEGVLELKCPKSATHFGYLRGDSKIPAEHLPQILHALFVTGAAWCDFLSFDPRFPAHLRTFYVRYYRNDAEVEAYAHKLRAFLDEVDREVVVAQGWHMAEANHV